MAGKKTMNSTKDMRDFLIDQMSAVANDEQDVATAKGVCNYAQQIYNTVNIELKYAIAKEKLGGSDVTPIGF